MLKVGKVIVLFLLGVSLLLLSLQWFAQHWLNNNFQDIVHQSIPNASVDISSSHLSLFNPEFTINHLTVASNHSEAVIQVEKLSLTNLEVDQEKIQFEIDANNIEVVSSGSLSQMLALASINDNELNSHILIRVNYQKPSKRLSIAIIEKADALANVAADIALSDFAFSKQIEQSLAVASIDKISITYQENSLVQRIMEMSAFFSGKSELKLAQDIVINYDDYIAQVNEPGVSRLLSVLEFKEQDLESFLVEPKHLFLEIEPKTPVTLGELSGRPMSYIVPHFFWAIEFNQ